MPRCRARFLVPVAIALALAPAVAGCGSEPVRVADRTLTVRLTEYRLEPQHVRVRAGRLTVVAVNRGRLTHNVHVVREDRANRERPATDLGGTRTAHPGETERHTFRRLRPGDYRLVCTVANHDDLGMRGTLEVVPAR